MKLGDIVDAWCSSCKLNLDMSVAAVTEDVIKQVQCRTCGYFVAYKPAVDMEKKRAAALKKLMKMDQDRSNLKNLNLFFPPIQSALIDLRFVFYKENLNV